MDETLDLLKISQEVLSFWKEKEVPKNLRNMRLSKNIGSLGYIEGPPTLNGVPHVGHSRGRAIKDLWYRFKTMEGYYVMFRAGWDTQGLPVELEVERELGFRSKVEALESLGMERFIDEIKQVVKKYYDVWRRVDEKFGIFFDYGREYITYKDDYIEREWKYLKAAWDQGLLGEGYRVVAYCPGCQTSLSNEEVALGYELLDDPSIYFKFKLKGLEETYLVLWTTMPFTLVTDEMVAVKPDEKYAFVTVGKERWVMASARVEEVMQKLNLKEYLIEKEVDGIDLKGIGYEHPFINLVPALRELEEHSNLVHKVTCAEFVDITTGTGIVHISPGNGEEDFMLASELQAPIFSPFDDKGNFTLDAGFFSNKFARNVDEEVVTLLKEHGLLLLCEKIVHEYPTCWRSHDRLLWVARREYFLWTDKIVDVIVKAAEKVNYFYDPPRNRFINILREGRPWCISRQRVWGTPIPIFICKSCGNKELLASRVEIVSRASSLPDGPDFELHRPWMDRVTIRCSLCGGEMLRIEPVLDTWHNSGAAPYCSLSDEEFSKFIPVEFLVEGIDQTRGWANSLLRLNVILKNEPESPYKAFLFLGTVNDENGRKMSKSLGNVIISESVLDRYGPDLMRLYMLWKASPIDAISFSFKEMTGRPLQILNTLYNLCKFLWQNAGYDNYNHNLHDLRWAIANKYLEAPDRWILSKLQTLVKEVTESFESARYNVGLKALENYVIEQLSRTYIQFIRMDLWREESEADVRRNVIYSVLYEILNTIHILINPVTPFFSEAMYQKVFRAFDSSLPESINYESWPTYDSSLVDSELESSFELLTGVMSLINSARQKAGLKRRWPLRSVHIVTNKERAEALKSYLKLLSQLCNCKQTPLLHQSLDELDVRVKPRLNTDRVGPRFGRKFGKVAEFVEANVREIKSSIEENGFVNINVEGEVLYLERDDITFELEPPEWASMALEENTIVLIDRRRDETLIVEGMMRDIARRIQALRKEMKLSPTEILERVYVCGLGKEHSDKLSYLIPELSALVRAKDVRFVDALPERLNYKEYSLDEVTIRIAIEF
ncbi:MAG: isoleucine--tRNA ligase [Thermoproteota archaeon]